MPPPDLINGNENNDEEHKNIPIQPPEDAPDKGGDTASEEIIEGEELLAEPQDHGHHAAFPILKNEQIPPDPGLPKSEIEPPPPRSIRGAPFFTADALKDPSPLGLNIDYSLFKERQEIEPNPAIVSMVITDKKLLEFWQDIDVTQKQIGEEIYSLRLARELLDLIKFARNEIMGGRDRYEEAERYLNEVKFRVGLADRVRLWTRKYAIWLFVYELLWGIGLVTILVTQMGSYAFDSTQSLNRALQINPDLIYLLSSMIWGSFGGVMGAIFALIKHVAVEQDFDKQHNIWYINSPLMGLGVGTATFLILRAGLLSLLGPEGGIVSPIVIYILALLGGYQHNVFTDIVKRMIQVFQVKDPTEKPKTPSQSQPVKPEIRDSSRD